MIVPVVIVRAVIVVVAVVVVHLRVVVVAVAATNEPLPMNNPPSHIHDDIQAMNTSSRSI